jgi:L-lactate dehydrogenase complex protein LldG
MIQARKAILQAAESGSPAAAAAISAAALALLTAPDEARPALPMPDIVDAFMARVCGPKVAAAVERIADLTALPGAVARLLAAKGLDARAAVQPAAALLALGWAEAGVTLCETVDEGVAVGLARWGIAETGSVVFHSSADMPILFNFLPAVHIVAVPAGNILAHLEDYAAAARAAGDPAPRNVCLITGASGTTDIEGDLVRGAHGPRELHVIVVDDIG